MKEQLTEQELMAKILDFLGLTYEQLGNFLNNTGATMQNLIDQVSPYVEIVTQSVAG